jgi:hypothetical protein
LNELATSPCGVTVFKAYLCKFIAIKPYIVKFST